MKHSVSHGLGKDRARGAVRAAFDSYRARFGKYDPRATWASPDRADIAFTAKGITVRGSIEIRDATIELELEVPFLLRPFKDKALGAVEKEIGVWIEKSRRGEV
jgi:hypothetical protein